MTAIDVSAGDSLEGKHFHWPNRPPEHRCAAPWMIRAGLWDRLAELRGAFPGDSTKRWYDHLHGRTRGISHCPSGSQGRPWAGIIKDCFTTRPCQRFDTKWMKFITDIHVPQEIHCKNVTLTTESATLRAIFRHFKGWLHPGFLLEPSLLANYEKCHGGVREKTTVLGSWPRVCMNSHSSVCHGQRRRADSQSYPVVTVSLALLEIREIWWSFHSH